MNSMNHQPSTIRQRLIDGATWLVIGLITVAVMTLLLTALVFCAVKFLAEHPIQLP